MAHVNRRLPTNVPGNFFVDSTCIDCDTCRWMAPEVFCRAAEQSAVYHQPENEAEWLRAMQALVSCPTASIGTVEPSRNVKAIHQTFPLSVAEDVYHCGYHAENSYGAASYFIQHPEGNLLVDSPRFAAPLARRLEEMGGIRYMFLTHRDDIADHQRFRERFGCDRIIHRDEVGPGTRNVEIQIAGTEPYALASDLLAIPTPGHTKGHIVLLYKDTFLFTGDSLAWSERYKQLVGFYNFCWYSWEELIKSTRKLAEYSFEWVLPGHGRRYHADRETMEQQMQVCLAWMEAQA